MKKVIDIIERLKWRRRPLDRSLDVRSPDGTFIVELVEEDFDLIGRQGWNFCTKARSPNGEHEVQVIVRKKKDE